MKVVLDASKHEKLHYSHLFTVSLSHDFIDGIGKKWENCEFVIKRPPKNTLAQNTCVHLGWAKSPAFPGGQDRGSPRPSNHPKQARRTFESHDARGIAQEEGQVMAAGHCTVRLGSNGDGGYLEDHPS